MFLLFINVFHNSLLIYLLSKIIKKNHDASILWYIICVMFFITIPLLFDSVLIEFYGQDYVTNLLLENNKYWTKNNFNNISEISYYSFFFDLSLIVTYFIFTRKDYENYESDQPYIFFNWPTIFIISLCSLIFFLINQGIFGISQLGTGRWNEGNVGNRWINLLSNIFITIAPIGVLKGLYKKNYLFGLLSAIPLLLIEYITTARAFIITLVFAIVYYFISQSSKENFQWGKIVAICIFGYIANITLTIYRSNNLGIYPLTVDSSYDNLFYSFKIAEHHSTHGQNFLRMISTGLFSADIDGVNTVESSLANIRYFKGWGTLHPTILGWAFFDMKNLFFVPALFFGIFYALFDRIRQYMPPTLNMLFLCIILRFTPIMVRGSVQYAYSNAIYPIIVFAIGAFIYCEFCRDL